MDKQRLDWIPFILYDVRHLLQKSKIVGRRHRLTIFKYFQYLTFEATPYLVKHQRQRYLCVLLSLPSAFI